MEHQASDKISHVEKILAELKAAGVVVPFDISLPEKVQAELTKRGVDLRGPGGLVLTHYFLIWAD